MDPIHYSVLYREVLKWLSPEKEKSVFLDGTLGEGGHSFRMLETFSDISLIGLDADVQMLGRARQRLEPFEGRTLLLNRWFNNLFADYPQDLPRPDLMLFDLGISVYHYEQTGRGFSFRKDEKLDMRLDPNLHLSAFEVVNDYSQKQLVEIFSKYGEEKFSGRIARVIVETRAVEKIETTTQLAALVKRSVPADSRHGRIHPATRIFQAIRIEVNGELDRLQQMLADAFETLTPGGKMGIITFHSLEDRIVKHFFKNKHKHNRVSQNKYAPDPNLPTPCAQLLFKKPIEPGKLELEENPPSRSARLRIIRKIKEGETCES